MNADAHAEPNGNGVPSGEPIFDRTRQDEPRRGTRLYEFPGGFIERWDDTEDETDPGVWVEFFDPE